LSPTIGQDLDPDAAYAELVIKNDSLEKELKELERIDKIVSELDPARVAELKRVYEQYEFALSMGGSNNVDRQPQAVQVKSEEASKSATSSQSQISFSFDEDSRFKD